MRKIAIALAASLAMISLAPAQSTLTLSVIGSVRSGPIRGEDPRIAEINAFDSAGNRIYIVNPLDGRLDVVDASNPASPVLAAPVNIVADCQAALGAACPVLVGSEPNSVAIRGSLMAIAVANALRTDNGHAVFYQLQGFDPPAFLAAVEVGALPDMIKFTEDGKHVLIANEGEPNQAYTVDPPGTVSIVDVETWSARTVGFDDYNTPEARDRLEEDGVRIFGPGATVAQDLEPEYIAVRSNKAYVTLQENNAIAIINIPEATVHSIVGLGRKDHSLPGNGLDPNDQDPPNIANWPVHGLYMPDAIDVIPYKGVNFYIMANEGDAREYTAYAEALRLGNAAYVLDPLFPNGAALKANTALGRLNVSKASGDIDGDGDYDRVDVFGARSISIRDEIGRLVWDSGDFFERLSLQFDNTLTVFNTTNTANTRDNRSDDKGIEPESVVVGKVGGRTYAFVGLERDGGIAVLDVSKPQAPIYVTYVTNRKLPRNPTTGALITTCNAANDCGDLGPEGLTFVPARQSPSGHALLIVSNEVSSTTTIWQVQ